MLFGGRKDDRPKVEKKKMTSQCSGRRGSPIGTNHGKTIWERKYILKERI